MKWPLCIKEVDCSEFKSLSDCFVGQHFEFTDDARAVFPEEWIYACVRIGTYI